MGNQCKNLPPLRDKSTLKEIYIDSTNEANVECVEEFDNPKRNILSSNFLSGLNCSSNDLQAIKLKEGTNNLSGYSRRFSLIKIDSIDIDKEQEPTVEFDDHHDDPHSGNWDKIK